jgi:hypothetical protein
MKIGEALLLTISTLSLSGCVHPNPAFPHSDHYDGRRFHNLEPVAPETFSDQLKIFWELQRKHGKWPKRFTTPQQEVDEKVVMDGPMVTFIVTRRFSCRWAE